MRTGDKLFVARGNIIHCQIAQPTNAKIGAGKRTGNVSVHHGAFEIIWIIVLLARGSRSKDSPGNPQRRHHQLRWDQ